MSSYHNRLRKILLSAHTCEQALWDRLSAEDKAQPSSLEPWAAKDLIGHLTGWRMRYAELLAALARGEIPARFENVEDINLDFFHHYQPQSFEEIQAEYLAANQSLLKAFDALDETLLNNPDLVEWMSGRTLWNYIAFTEYWHPMDHQLKWLVEQGQSDQANSLQARILEEMSSLDESEAWQGTNLYNDACYEALFGDRDLAVQILEKALSLNPELVEWSKQDSDLDSLREMKAFKSIYTD
jgi:tetratricopeptide (TPR) repeat protein